MAGELGQTTFAFPWRRVLEEAPRLRGRLRTTGAPASGVFQRDAAADPALVPAAPTSGGRSPEEEPWSPKGRLWRLSPGQRLAQSPKYLRPGFEEETEELGGPTARAFEV